MCSKKIVGNKGPVALGNILVWGRNMNFIDLEIKSQFILKWTVTFSKMIDEPNITVPYTLMVY